MTNIRKLLARMAVILIVPALLSACSNTNRKPDINQKPQPKVIGGDRDAHGCLIAAGYTWCARENACVRSWELAKAKGFDATPDGFERYCSPTTKSGE